MLGHQHVLLAGYDSWKKQLRNTKTEMTELMRVSFSVLAAILMPTC